MAVVKYCSLFSKTTEIYSVTLDCNGESGRIILSPARTIFWLNGASNDLDWFDHLRMVPKLRQSKIWVTKLFPGETTSRRPTSEYLTTTVILSISLNLFIGSALYRTMRLFELLWQVTTGKSRFVWVTISRVSRHTWLPLERLDKTDELYRSELELAPDVVELTSPREVKDVTWIRTSA